MLFSGFLFVRAVGQYVGEDGEDDDDGHHIKEQKISFFFRSCMCTRLMGCLYFFVHHAVFCSSFAEMWALYFNIGCEVDAHGIIWKMDIKALALSLVGNAYHLRK